MPFLDGLLIEVMSQIPEPDCFESPWFTSRDSRDSPRRYIYVLTAADPGVNVAPPWGRRIEHTEARLPRPCYTCAGCPSGSASSTS